MIAVDELGTELRWWEPPRAGTRQVVAADEVVTEVRWWEWLGVVFQYNMKWDKMARKLEAKGNRKVGVLAHYISFTGALSPSLALLVGDSIVPSTILYGSPVWGRVAPSGGVADGRTSGMTKRDQDKLAGVQNRLLRSVFGGIKRGQMLSVLRAEAGWCTVELEVAVSIVRYYGRVSRMEGTRPVRIFLRHAVAAEVDQREGGSTEMGRKFVRAAQAVFGAGGEVNLEGRWSVGGWKTLVSRSMVIAKQAEMEAQCGLKPTGVEYLLYRERGCGQAYYIQRAVGVVKWGKRKALNRIVHMRSGGHLLGKVGRLFGVGDEGGLCTSCTARVRDSPQHFVFGCSHTDGLRHGFWQVLEEVAGMGFVTTFKGWGHRKQWLELMSWLDGDGPFEDDEFDVVLEALVDLVAGLLKAHPTWG